MGFSAADFFYVSVGLSVWVVAAVVILVLVEARETLKSVQKMTNRVSSTVADIEMFKSGLKLGLLTLVSNILGKARKGGEVKE